MKLVEFRFKVKLYIKINKIQFGKTGLSRFEEHTKPPLFKHQYSEPSRADIYGFPSVLFLLVINFVIGYISWQKTSQAEAAKSVDNPNHKSFPYFYKQHITLC